MFVTKDDTYDELREKSIHQWLEELSAHEDVAVRSGVSVTKEYIQGLHNKILRLEKKNEVKDTYLKKLKEAKEKSF